MVPIILMRVLVLCEFSGRVRDAFIAKGHEAISVDLEPSERPGPHVIANIRNYVWDFSEFDLVIAFPPCTYLSAAGARWWKGREYLQNEALEFVRWIMNLPVEKIALENPTGAINSRIRKPDQIIEPYWFGDPVNKRTCLWLKGLPLLVPTNLVQGSNKFMNSTPMSNEKRKKYRSRTFQGIANAMAEQWG